MQVSKDDERRRNDRLAKQFMLQSKAHVLLPDACSVLTKHEGARSSHGMAESDKWEAAETKDVFCLKKLDVWAGNFPHSKVTVRTATRA